MNTIRSGIILAVFAASMLGCSTDGGYSTYRMAPAKSGTYRAESIYVPAMDPARKKSEQDCTKPFTQDGGNLVCK